MQINIALSHNNAAQAEQIRASWYPGSTARQTRDSFVFNTAIDRFKSNPEVLLPIIESEEGSAVAQRMLTIKAESAERLKTIASAIGKPAAATYRAIIKYTIEHLDNSSTDDDEQNVDLSADVSQLIMEKLGKLEKQLEECNNTRLEIVQLLKR